MTVEYLTRALCCLLQSLQGSYASGNVTATATGATTLLPKRTFGIPVVRGQLNEDLAVVAEPNPATTDGSWSVTSAGVSVAVTSIAGGPAVNLAAGTQVLWESPPTGIEEEAVVDSSGLTGGVQLATRGALRQVRAYRDLGAKPAASDFFAGRVGDYPAAVLAWVRTTPATGSTSPTLSSNLGRVGRGSQLYVHEWMLHLVTSRLDGSDPRSREGTILRDNALKLLTDRQAWRGLPLSTTRGIQILEATLAGTTPATYVDVVRFATVFTLTRTDERVYYDWLKTNLRVGLLTSQGQMDVVDVDDVMPTT